MFEWDLNQATISSDNQSPDPVLHAETPELKTLCKEAFSKYSHRDTD
jgi:hypothetical protein